MIFLRINCPNVIDWYSAAIPNSRLVWRPPYLPYCFRRHCHHLRINFVLFGWMYSRIQTVIRNNWRKMELAARDRAGQRQVARGNDKAQVKSMWFPEEGKRRHGRARKSWNDAIMYSSNSSKLGLVWRVSPSRPVPPLLSLPFPFLSSPPLPSHSSLPFSSLSSSSPSLHAFSSLRSRSHLFQLVGLGKRSKLPSGAWGRAKLKLIMVRSSPKIWHLVATILMIFLRITAQISLDWYEVLHQISNWYAMPLLAPLIM